MSKNRQQLKTGLRAILGGGLREESAAGPDAGESTPLAEMALHATEIEEVAAPPKPVPVLVPEPVVVEEAREETPLAAAVAEEPSRKQRKRPAPAPPEPKPKVATAASVRVGTLESPYVRKRDNLPTRKVGIVLPVALAERMQIHCVKARTRPNEFVARAIEALLDELQA